MHGWAAYRVHTKLKILKPEIKQWSKVTYGKMDATINSSKQDIEELEAKAEESVLDEQEIVKEGDANTKSFHAVINHRRCTNELKTIRFEDRWIEGVVEVKEAAKNFFKNHFVEPMLNRPLLQGVSFGQLSLEAKQRMIKAPTKVQAFGWQIVMGQVTNKTKYEEKRNYGGYWMCFLWKVWKKISSFPVKWRIWFGMISFCGYKCLSLGVVCM
ncbi:hypothetical protein RIF29_35600 [Crotalaria pallida]|uniref:Uncharacterized protein n=1 Tax=Crotalaria pallida TaxID=3830 RepID=A0AAN9HY17_CROPI